MECRIIVKRRGHKEDFDEKKVYASIYMGCRMTGIGEQRAEEIAKATMEAVENKFAMCREIDSQEIFDFVCKEMERHDKDAAYMYKTHRDLS